VTPGTLHSLFERHFGGTDGAGRIDARHAAELAAGMERGDPTNGELADNPERSTALLAAYLDGGLDDAAQQEVHARLSNSPAQVHEVASADAFLDAMESARVTAPADLVTTTISKRRTAAVLIPPPRQSSAIWKWSGMVVAVAVAVVAVLVIVNHHAVPTDNAVPIATKAVPGKVASPETPMIAKPQIPHGGVPLPGATPAASEESTPRTHPRREQPTMAPEGLDTAPGPSH